MPGRSGSFIVIKVDREHRFALVESELSREIGHTELYPEGHSLQLREGDRISGVLRGQSVSGVTWLARMPPPAELQVEQEAILERLRDFGLLVSGNVEDLAHFVWREGRSAHPLAVSLASQFKQWFDRPEVVTYLVDRGLLPRI